jgi:hypothetical protein
VNVAVEPLYVTVPDTAPPGPDTVKVPAVVIEAEFIAMLNVAVTFVPIATPVAPGVGVTDTTTGRVTVS